MSTGQLLRKGLQVACARVNQFRKAKERVYEDVPDKLEKFYEELNSEESPMFEMRWTFPDPDTGKVNSGELVFNIVGPDSIKKMVPLMERLQGPKPKGKKAGDGNKPPSGDDKKDPPKDKPKDDKKDAPKEEKKDPPKEEKKDPPSDSKQVDDGLFDDD